MEFFLKLLGINSRVLCSFGPGFGSASVSKMEESIDHQASLLTAQNPEGWGTLPSVSGR